MRGLLVLVILVACPAGCSSDEGERATSNPPPTTTPRPRDAATAKTNKPSPVWARTLPKVDAGALEAWRPNDKSVVIEVAKTSIRVNGRSIVAVRNNEIDAAVLDRQQLTITPLARFLKALDTKGRVYLALHSGAHYRLFLQVTASARSTSKHFALLVRDRAGQIRIAPFTLPVRPSSSARRPRKNAPPRPGLVVAVTQTQLMLFSTSGLVGTLQHPALRQSPPFDLDKLRDRLSVAAKKRFGGEATARRIVLVADSRIAIQTVAEVFAAVTHASFSDVVFSAGFM